MNYLSIIPSQVRTWNGVERAENRGSPPEKKIEVEGPLNSQENLTFRDNGVSTLLNTQTPQRMRRSPCLSDLVAACRGTRHSGERAVADLVQAHPEFFRDRSGTPSPRETMRYRSTTNLDRILESGLMSRANLPVIPEAILDYDEQNQKTILSQSRASALRFAGSVVPPVSSLLEFEVSPALVEQLTGYPFETPADIIRNHGADLIDQGFITPHSLNTVIRQNYSESIFLGPHIPQEAIIGVYQAGKCIWRRPVEAMEVEKNGSGLDSETNYDRILNVAIGATSHVDDDVSLAQRYLYRKHPSKTDNYILRPPNISGTPATIQRISTPPNTARPNKNAQIHVLGNHQSGEGASFGEARFEDLCEILASLIKKRRWQGEISMEPIININFIGCGTLNEQQIEQLRTSFRLKGLPAPFITHRIHSVSDREDPSSALDLIITLSPDQSSQRIFQELKRSYPSALEYNLRKPGPNVEMPILYRRSFISKSPPQASQLPINISTRGRATGGETSSLQASRPPELLRINIISHGNTSNQLEGISFETLAKTLANLVHRGQQTGEFNAEAKVTLNFVACKISSEQLTSIYQIFKEKNIQLVRSVHRNTELMVDTVGRKLQLGESGEWRHAHLKEVFQFGVNGEAQRVSQKRLSKASDLLTLKHAAGPLATVSETRHLMEKVQQTMDSMRRENQLDAEWRPDLETLDKMENGEYRMNFRRGQNTVSIATRTPSLGALYKSIKVHTEIVGKHHRFDGETLMPLETSSQLTTHNDASHSISQANRLLSSIFAIRTLLGLPSQGQEPYAAEIRAHVFVNLAQSVHILGNEAVNLVEQVRAMFRQEIASAKEESLAAKFIGAANRAVGRVFIGANVGFDLQELIQAKTPEETLRSSIALGLDGSMLGLETASTLGVASSVTGPLGLLLGLSTVIIEMGEHIFEQHHQEKTALESIYRYFENLKQAYQNPVQYNPQQNFLKFHPGAIITSLDLGDAPEIQFGSQELTTGYRITCKKQWNPASGLTGEVYFKRASQPLSVRSKMGWSAQMPISQESAQASNILLPAVPITRLDYTYSRYGSGIPDPSEGFAILQQLSRGGAFVFTSCGLAVRSLIPKPKETSIRVRLGRRNRAVFLPPNLHKEIGKHLKYTLEGSGGLYRLFPARNAHFTLRDTPASSSTWIIDLSHLEGLDDLQHTFTAGTLTFQDVERGPVQLNIAEVKGEIEVRTKYRTWRFERKNNALQLTQMDFGENKIPESEGGALQTAIGSKLTLVLLLRLIRQLGLSDVKDVKLGKHLAEVFQNYSVNTNDYVRLDHFPAEDMSTIGTVIYDTVNKTLIPLSNIANVWSQSGSTFVSQVFPQQKATNIEAIYRLNKKGNPELIKLSVPMESWRSRLPSTGPISASEALRVLNHLIGTDSLIPPSAIAHPILLGGYDKQKREHLFWLETQQDELIALGGNLPSDAIPIALTHRTISGQVCFFYSDSAKTLYRKIQGNGPFFESATPSTPVMEKLRGLKLQNGNLYAEDQYGIVYQIAATGNKKVAMLTSHWMATRGAKWAEDVVQLCRTQQLEDHKIEIAGLQLENGDVVSCWYDKSQNQFSIISTRQTKEKLVYLGPVTKEGGAWFFQAATGRLYQQPTFAPEWARLITRPNGKLFSSAHFTPLKPVLPHEKIDTATYQHDGRVIVSTHSGLTLLIEPGKINRPLVLAVNQKWLSQESNKGSHLAYFSSDQNYRFPWSISLPTTGSRRHPQFANWYDVAAQKPISVPLEKLPVPVRYVGSADSIAYLGNHESVLGLRVNENPQQAATTSTRFKDPHRAGSILSLQAIPPVPGRPNTPPLLVGVQTLLLHGNMDRIAISQALWNHHRLIMFSRLPSADATLLPEKLELNFNNAENLVLSRKDNDLILGFPNSTGLSHLIFDRFFDPERNGNLSLKLPNGIEKKLIAHSLNLLGNRTKPLKDLPT